MKATILSLSLAALTMCSAEALAQSPFQLGVKVTSNHSNIAGNLTNLSRSNALGFSAGITTQYHFDRLFLQADLLYSESKSDVDHTGIQQAKWKSIDIPLAIGYNILDLNKIKVHITAGGVYSQVIDDKLTLAENLGSLDNRWNKNNIKAQLGAGVSWGKFSFDLVYARSLNNLTKDFKSKSNHVQVGLSYYFL
ncbi:porin family protein [Myroides sp. WP-1]|uniref:porin family protein n=1 Tax=Myroides sp. WP-1 TaxID=2759944 RepID=UPI0015FCCD28|nr:porin family protein [Myroides sp. WP-1]MBB1137904.1 porin family protein [Myroides sp. WP-1]